MHSNRYSNIPRHKRRYVVYKQAMPGYHEQPSASFAPVTSLFSLVGRLERIQVLAIMFLLLISGSYVLAASDRVLKSKDKDSKTPKLAKDKSSLTKQIYTEVCTDKSKLTFNKPPIALGFNQNKIVPLSCIQGDLSACINGVAAINSYIPAVDKSKHLRSLTRDKHNKWVQSILSEAKQIALRQTKYQNDIFYDIFDFIQSLKLSSISSATAIELNGGRCGEHKNVALIALLNKKLRYGLEMKIQQVDVEVTLSSDTSRDHSYLLLDSNVDDVTIKNDKVKVKKALGIISKGKICDPWNDGRLVDFKTDDSSFYSAEAGWDSLVIITHTLNFAKFKELSIDAKRFICREMTAMGLDLEPREQCLMFNVQANKQSEAELKEQQAVRMEL